MVLAGTGHRPHKLGGYFEKVLSRLTDLAKASLQKFKPDTVITGMALGWDTALAKAALQLKIPFVAALPCESQDSLWPTASRELYSFLLKQAVEVVMCGPGGPYASWKMQVRNQWMVDNSDLVLALWDGSTGGTANCIAYANKVDKEVFNLWKSWEKYKNV